MIQNSRILKNDIDHLNKRGPTPFFHSDTNLVLENVLVHPVEKTRVLFVRVEFVWLLFLNILSFNFVQTPSKPPRFRKFRRSNVHRSDVVQTNHCQSCTTFFALRALFKVVTYLFCGCLSPTLVHLLNLFLMNTPVAQMLLTPRWVSRQKDMK